MPMEMGKSTLNMVHVFYSDILELTIDFMCVISWNIDELLLAVVIHCCSAN